MNTTQKRLISMLLALTLLIVCVPLLQTEADAASSDYMTLEQAGAVLRQHMVERRTDWVTIKFYIKNDRQMNNIQDALVNEAIKHTGNGKEGDALRWSYNVFSCNVVDDFDGTTHYVTFEIQSIGYMSSASQEKELDAKVAEILQSLNLSGKSDYEKVKAIYEYVCSNVVYADEVYANGTPDIWNVPEEHYNFYSAHGALVNGKATCQGYAIAMYRLLLEAGVDNRLITGDAAGLPHGWNIVKIGDLYYNLDATWDAGADFTQENIPYFLKGAATFIRDHLTHAYCATEEFRSKYPISGLDYGADTNITASGVCGDSAIWTLSVDGTLTVSGTGQICGDLAGWVPYRGYIQKIIIENGITAIGNCAFEYCQEVTSVTIPSTVTTIGYNAFYACGKLKTVTLPNSVTSVGANCFAFCWDLESAVLSNQMTAISSQMFDNCLQLQTVTIPNSVTSIEKMAFSGCVSLQSVTIPNSVKSIGNGAFASAFDPEVKASITIPASVTTVGETCFAWSGLREVIWNASTTRLESQMFYNTPYIENIVLSDTITWIGEEVCMSCVNLKSINLPAKLETFQGEWQGAFENCWSLQSITIPSTLKIIPARTFQTCRSLKTVVFEEGLEEIGGFAFAGCSFEQITLPESLRTIGEYAFADNLIKSIVIPKNVTSIGTYAFSFCKNLTKVEFKGNAPQIGEFAFNSTAEGTYLYVYHPEGDPTWTDAVKIDYSGSGNMKWAHGANEPHSYAYDWYTYYNENTHYRECSGCDYKEIVEHAFENSCDTYCEECNHFREITHSYQWEWLEYGHWKICTVCGTTDASAPHTWSGGVCTECGAQQEGSSETTPTEPPATEPPATEPPATEPPATEPPATEPPATEPPATEPPATEPPATEPPATEPPATEPPATEPPATEPPATEPPATEPPATEPPATEPPATEPPATEPSVTEPKPAESTPLESTTTPVAPSTSADEKQPEKSSPVLWIVIAVLVLGGTAAVILIKKPGKKV